jgi:heme-degrading monooxygenase HmoA
MILIVSVRKIKPGTYDDFRRAWEPDPWYPGLTRVSISRGDEDPDEVLTVGHFDLSIEAFDELRDSPEFLSQEERRLRALSEFEETVRLSEVYVLQEEIARS